MKRAIENVNLIYANQYTLDGLTEVEEKNKQIKIENYKEEVSNQWFQIAASNVGRYIKYYIRKCGWIESRSCASKGIQL